jgi:peptidoglycan/LPS O-acetylase OafA/YrhL
LREYAAQRLVLPTVKTVEELQGMVVRAERIQDALWAQVTTMSERPNTNLIGFIQSLTVLTDLQIKRVRAAVWNRIPGVIVLALYGIAFLALMALGFNSGMNEPRPGIPAIVLALAFSSVIVLIVDLERPRQQLFTVSQEPMADVVRRIQPVKP